eukprot:11048191-Ditylum_brightwellii.AAC.1
MVLTQQTIVPLNSNSTSTASSSKAKETSPVAGGPLQQDIQLALSTAADCTYTSADTPQVNKRQSGDVWKAFKILQQAR